ADSALLVDAARVVGTVRVAVAQHGAEPTRPVAVGGQALHVALRVRVAARADLPGHIRALTRGNDADEKQQPHDATNLPREDRARQLRTLLGSQATPRHTG